MRAWICQIICRHDTCGPLILQDFVVPHRLLGAAPGSRFALTGVVCYYGAHYTAATRLAGRWWTVDDAIVDCPGSWAALIEKMVKGHSRPRMLLFQRCC